MCDKTNTIPPPKENIYQDHGITATCGLETTCDKQAPLATTNPAPYPSFVCHFGRQILCIRPRTALAVVENAKYGGQVVHKKAVRQTSYRMEACKLPAWKPFFSCRKQVVLVTSRALNEARQPDICRRPYAYKYIPVSTGCKIDRPKQMNWQYNA